PRGSRRRARTSTREATVVRTSREPPCPHTSPYGRITRATQAWGRDPGGRDRAARSSRYQGGRLIRSTTRTEVEVAARRANTEERAHSVRRDDRTVGGGDPCAATIKSAARIDSRFRLPRGGRCLTMSATNAADQGDDSGNGPQRDNRHDLLQAVRERRHPTVH